MADDLARVIQARADIGTEEENHEPVSTSEDVPAMRKCKICSKMVKVKGYKAHITQQHSGKTFFCHLCHYISNRKVNFVAHIAVHKKDMNWLDDDFQPKFSKEECKFKCKSCSKAFITKDCAQMHEKRKHGKGNFQCGKCERKFSDQNILKSHIKRCEVKMATLQ